MAPPVVATSGQTTGPSWGVYGPAIDLAVAIPIQWCAEFDLSSPEYVMM